MSLLTQTKIDKNNQAFTPEEIIWLLEMMNEDRWICRLKYACMRGTDRWITWLSY